MIFRQLFDHESYTYTYLLADENTREAALFDPVKERVEHYLTLLRELDLRLAVALDTHVHADHITGLGELREKTGCVTYLSNAGNVACADKGLSDGQKILVGSIVITAMYTPGHTDDSYSFYVDLPDGPLLFSGDTLLIRGTGRTDFQNGNAEQLYDSLHQKLMTLPLETRVFPGHDYKGWSMSTIGEEKRCNPRVAIANKPEFVTFMHNLKLPNPKWMDVAVPANLACGKR